MAYCQLNLWLKVSKLNISRSKYTVSRSIYRLKCFVLESILDSFLFRKIFRSQVQATFREAVEGQNGALVILDWYIPNKLVKICSECGHFIPKTGGYTTNPMEVGGTHQVQESAVETDAPIGDANSSVRSSHSSSKLVALKTTISCPTLYDRDISSVSLLEGVIAELNEQLTSEENQLMNESVLKRESLSHKTFELTNAKVARGVVIIIGDMNVSYNVSFQQTSCNCANKCDNMDKKCEVCMKDYVGLNAEPPTIIATKCLIKDLLRLGFICINIHLNINLGMASEAYPGLIGLRSFPISLYSNVLVDLDCVLNRISERFPTSPLSFISVGFGANILMEYISLASSHRSFKTAPDMDQDANPSNLHSMFSKMNSTQNPQVGKLASLGEMRTNNTLTFNLNLKPETSDSNPSEFDKLQHFLQINDPVNTTDSNDIHIKDGFYMSKIVPDKKYSFLSNADPPNVPMQSDDYKTQDGSANGDISDRKNMNNTDDNMGNEDNKEFTVGTRVIFPHPLSCELSFNIKNISSVVCINLNLREHDNVLYNFTKINDYEDSCPYRKLCTSSLSSNLLQLLNQIKYTRKSSSTKRDQKLSCGHYGKEKNSGNLKKLFNRSGTRSATNKDSGALSIVEQTITRLHREYHNSYREMKKNTLTFINYGSMLFESMGIRSCADFKISILMTLKQRIEGLTQDIRGKSRITEIPIYNYTNRKISTCLRLGRTSFDSNRDRFIANIKRFPDYKISRYINGLINREYARNISNIKKNLECVSIPTLFLYSLDTSLFGWKDIDIFDVIKLVLYGDDHYNIYRNPNFVYYVCQSGGYSTFLTGLHPFPWFIGPTIEFLEEMTTKSFTF
ncbi:hypothetical protein BEWA_010830 [Theileria equi strain WA]|uniref:Uncharacterized protein n=1 Tax=Theileria equi strain WA TaxID=1537102 RepID=L0B364_THEEQ|nr:hypothetical protein BEWA_010830 [Theileria equi strain WA]AFZ81666.1 hypothetical protein BEWA_010830 [Theileria equi strain WA]|eukprot:XP_004831332.1 hypothetical protein BEWA_010830 [Theileria equi strain WA]